jgi:hypothetical protein
MTRVRIVAKKRPKPQQINGVAAPQARRRSRPCLPGAMSVQHLVAHGVNNCGLVSFEKALHAEIALVARRRERPRIEVETV